MSSQPVAPDSPADSSSDDVRDRILAAAKTEFASNGLKGSSVRAIGKRAGVTAAMINYYFGGKRALYEVLVEQALSRLVERLSEAFVTNESTDLPARLAGVYFDFLFEEHEFQRLIAREVLDRGDGVSDYALRHMAPLRALFEHQFGSGDFAIQGAISIFGAVAGYFLYEPVLSELLGKSPLAPEQLASRRRHVMKLASVVSRMEADE